LARNLSAICAALKAHLPNGQLIEAVSPLSHGHSNETYLVTGIDQILRLPPSEAPLLGQARIHGVVSQYEIVRELSTIEHGPPVPDLGFLDAEGRILGDPFFLMERCPGEAWGDWGAPDWVTEGNESKNTAVSEQVLQFYGRLHSHTPLVSLGSATTATQELERWRTPISNFADPTLLEAFDRLAAIAPSEQTPAPCHGDAKLANMLWHEGRLTAVLDWEMAFNGDPRWDLAYFVQFFDSPSFAGLPGFDSRGLWQRERIIAEWEKRTGRSSKGFAWFEAATKAKGAAIMGYGIWLYQSGRSTDVRYSTWGEAVRERGEIALAMAKSL
jgi:aminoglycoside phosphotransferase (APT) family kinase protein